MYSIASSEHEVDFDLDMRSPMNSTNPYDKHMRRGSKRSDKQ